MSSNKKYWKSVEELENGSIVEALRNNEFVEEIPTDEFLGNADAMSSSSTSRRDFLKYVGFSTAAATLAHVKALCTSRYLMYYNRSKSSLE